MSSNQREINYEFLTSSQNFLYDAREDGKTHTPFHYELLLFRAIQNGDRKGVEDSLTQYQNSGLIIGHMSDNPLREIHLGGLDESEAYQLSDEYIQEIDSLKTMEECIHYLCEKAMELVKKVKENTIPQCSSPLINQCVHLIHIHLHSRLKIEDLARSLHVSRDYLSAAFKKDRKISLHRYILDQKLQEAKRILSNGMSINETSYTLCFCNESHFIQLFKKKYGMTPGEYVAGCSRC